jgi:DNA processing protein
MLSTARSFTVDAHEARPVTVEVDVHRGLPSFSIVGLPDAAVREGRELLRAALLNCGFEFPLRRIVANLAPVGLRKRGPGLDLAMAVALLCASGQLSWERLPRLALIGELSLDGSLRPVAGALAIAEAAREEGLEAVVVPVENAAEARRAAIEVIGLLSLSQLPALAAGEGEWAQPTPPAPEAVSIEPQRPASGPRPRSSATTEPSACPECLRRSWLLALLAPYMEKTSGEAPGRGISELLGFCNEDLVQRVASREGPRLLARVAAMSERRLREELAAAQSWACCHHEQLYPDALRDAPNAPWALIGRGEAALLEDLTASDTVTVVGARRASTYGREVARNLGRELAEAGIVVVSGLAFGVDACAHRGALEAGRTFAVLGCGPDVAYPASHRSLWRRICERGLVLSELPPGAGAWRWTFPARNRIMAALGGMTVVVEAAERSGSLITAEIAADLGRDLGAVPGPVTSRSSAGPNSLLAGGAHVIRGAQDVLDAMLGPGPRPGRRRPASS